MKLLASVLLVASVSAWADCPLYGPCYDPPKSWAPPPVYTPPVYQPYKPLYTPPQQPAVIMPIGGDHDYIIQQGGKTTVCLEGAGGVVFCN